jgi:hypothetical protein
MLEHSREERPEVTVKNARMRLDRGMDATAGSLITAFDYVWSRVTGRLAGLTDEEYFWEPVAGCWSLREGDGGRWQLDGGGGGGPAPDPARVTTIAWRLGHLGGMAVGGFANRRFGDGALTTARIGFPPGAAAVPGFLDGHYRAWRGGLAGLSPGRVGRAARAIPGALCRGDHGRSGTARAGRGHPSRRRDRRAQRPLLPSRLAARLRRPRHDQDERQVPSVALIYRDMAAATGVEWLPVPAAVAFA